MAINEQASREATSKSPCPSLLGKPGRMARLVAHRATAAAAARSRCAHAATAAAPAARAGCAVRCGTTACIGVAKRIKGLPVCGPRQPRSIKVGMGWR